MCFFSYPNPQVTGYLGPKNTTGPIQVHSLLQSPVGSNDSKGNTERAFLPGKIVDFSNPEILQMGGSTTN